MTTDITSENVERKRFEHWMIHEAKIIVGSDDPYPKLLEQRYWECWKAATSALRAEALAAAIERQTIERCAAEADKQPVANGIAKRIRALPPTADRSALDRMLDEEFESTLNAACYLMTQQFGDTSLARPEFRERIRALKRQTGEAEE